MGPLDTIIRTVRQLMTRYGGDAELVQDTGTGTYNYETSEYEPIVITSTVRALSFEYLAKRDGLSTQGNTMIEAGDKWFFVQPKEGVSFPKPKRDNVVFSGKKYNVISVKDVNPSGSLSVLWELQLRE